MSRMNRARAKASGGGVRTGTLTLLLLVVAIVLAVVAVLAMQTARSNQTRADEFANNVEQFYKNDSAGQEMLAALDEILASGGSLTVGDVRAVLPESFEVNANSVRGAYLNEQPVAYDSIHLESKTYDEGIASDGRSNVDAESDPALLVTVQISTQGYKVREWTHVRAYKDSNAESETSLFTGEGSELQEEGSTGETGDPAQNNELADTPQDWAQAEGAGEAGEGAGEQADAAGDAGAAGGSEAAGGADAGEAAGEPAPQTPGSTAAQQDEEPAEEQPASRV